MKNNKFSYLFLYLYSSCTTHKFIYIFLLIIFIILLFVLNHQSNKINESFINSNKNHETFINPNKNHETFINPIKTLETFINQKINLSCDVDNNNVYNCKPLDGSQVPIHYETGVGLSNTSGTIQFKKEFNKIPSVFATPLLEITNPIYTSTTSINIYNITTNGFSYVKNQIENGVDEEFSEITSLNKDNLSKFNWMAIEQN